MVGLCSLINNFVRCINRAAIECNTIVAAPQNIQCTGVDRSAVLKRAVINGYAFAGIDSALIVKSFTAFYKNGGVSFSSFGVVEKLPA